MKTYRGRRTDRGCRVTVNGRRLRLRLDLRNHSPTGFEWGYGGSGPSQLALALLADAIGDEASLEHYQRFKRTTVSSLPTGCWELTDTDIRRWIEVEINALE